MMTGTDCRGVPVSTSNTALIDTLDRALEASLAFRGDPIAIIDEALSEDPSFVMGHLFKAAMLTQAMETRIYGLMVHHLEAAEALSGSS